MANYFSITPFLSFRWVQRNAPIDNRYNSKPLASLPSDYQQKWQCGGMGFDGEEHGGDINGWAQALSDFACTMKIYGAEFDTLVQTVALTSSPISGQTFLAYDWFVDFSSLQEGLYYATISYTDENEVVQNWDTDIWDVQIFHENTKLYEATNTFNDKGVVFVNPDDTLKKASFRVEGMLRSPVPKSQDEDFEDQPYNLTQLSSIPYTNITDLIGYNEYRLPFWVIEKINLLYSLNKVQVDGQYFTAISGSEWKPTRPTNQEDEDGYWEIEVQPNYAYDFQQFSTDLGPVNDEFRVIIDALPYPGQTESVLIAGLFKTRMKLNGLNIINNGGDAFDINIGTSAPIDGVPSNDIATVNVEAVEVGDTTTDKKGKFYLINHSFTANHDVYINMPSGVNIDMDVEYTDYVAVSIEQPTPVSKWYEDTLYTFVENTDGHFAREFDIATGFGRVGTDHEHCVLTGVMDTIDTAGLIIQGWDKSLPLTRETSIGDNSITVTKANLPNITLNLNRNAAGPGGSGTSTTQVAVNQGNAGPNFPVAVVPLGGSGDPIDTTPHVIILAQFYYIKPV